MTRLWVNLPDSLSQSFQDYADRTGQKKTQIVMYAIASYIGYYQTKDNSNKVDDQALLNVKIDDLSIDVQDVETYLEKIEKRLSRIEHQFTNNFTDYDKALIKDFTEDCLKTNQKFTVKDILNILDLDCNDNSLQRKVAYYLRSQGWEKVRRNIDKKKQYVWVKK